MYVHSTRFDSTILQVEVEPSGSNISAPPLPPSTPLGAATNDACCDVAWMQGSCL